MSYENPPPVPPASGTLTPPVPGPPPHRDAPPSRTLSVLALVFAIVVPVVGLVLALVAGSRARRAGRRQDGLTMAALIVSIVLTVLGLVALVILGIVSLFLVARADPPVTPQKGDIVVTVSATDGDVGDSALRAAVDDVVTHRLQRAGIDDALLAHGADGAWIVRFAADTTPQNAAQAASLIAAPIDGGIARVLAVDDAGVGTFGTSDALTDDVKAAFTAVDCAQTLEGPVDVGGGLSVACASDQSAKYLIGAVEIPASAIDDVTADTQTLQVDFGREGAALLSDLTTAVVGQTPPDNQIAIVTGGDVLMAPVVQSEITDGSVQIAGGTVEELRELRAQLLVLARGVTIAADAAPTGG